MKRPILIVDDDRDMVRTLCDIFRMRGWDSSGAYSGEEALERQRAAPSPLVLMDVKMPGMDGVAAFKAMKQEDPDVKVILMTAHTSPEVMRAAEQEGAWQVISKPVDIGSLLALLD